jgi:hypothetical protein
MNNIDSRSVVRRAILFADNLTEVNTFNLSGQISSTVFKIHSFTISPSVKGFPAIAKYELLENLLLQETHFDVTVL